MAGMWFVAGILGQYGLGGLGVVLRGNGGDTGKEAHLEESILGNGDQDFFGCVSVVGRGLRVVDRLLIRPLVSVITSPAALTGRACFLLFLVDVSSAKT